MSSQDGGLNNNINASAHGVILRLIPMAALLLSFILILGPGGAYAALTESINRSAAENAAAGGDAAAGDVTTGGSAENDSAAGSTGSAAAGGNEAGGGDTAANIAEPAGGAENVAAGANAVNIAVVPAISPALSVTEPEHGDDVTVPATSPTLSVTEPEHGDAALVSAVDAHGVSNVPATSPAESVAKDEHGDAAKISVAAPATSPAEPVAGAAFAGAGFPSLKSAFEHLCDLSAEVALEHQVQLDRRTYAISYAYQISAAKYLAQSAYKTKMAYRDDFIAAHGKLASEMDDKEISGRYDNDYFIGRLSDLGFFKEDKYGKDVNKRNAIIRAQSSFNIPITAKIDLNTKRALIEGTDYLPKDVITGEHPEGMWVVIDKSARILTVYVDDTVFMKYPVAVGKSISLTPEGQFTFVSKAKNPRWGGGGYAEPVAGGAPNNPLGKRWMGLSKGGGGAYGVHGNVSAYSIGTNASHGCVRMINSDVEEMFEYIAIGTPVWIGTTDKLHEWGIFQLLGSWPPNPPDYRDYLPETPFYAE